eukprot:239244-Karenia_brevis.AAC.1
MDTHQAHRALREIIIEDGGPPKLLPSSRGFHATVLKFARQFQSWFESMYGRLHANVVVVPGIGRFRPCNKPFMVPVTRVAEAEYPVCACGNQ